jgi:ketosteroid isomerase-like protein
MSRENVELIRRMFGCWNAGDIHGWVSCSHPDIEWTSEPFGALDGKPRTYRGHDELRSFATDVLEGFADLGRIERLEYREVGDSVLALGVYTARAGSGGPEVATPMGWLFVVRDGKIARGRDFLDQRRALEAAERGA